MLLPQILHHTRRSLPQKLLIPQLPLPASSFGNPTAVAEAIKATLLKDPKIDGVITVSAADADSAANGI